MLYDFVTLDVFTDTTFGGNPLAVLPDARGLTTEQMQAIAREFNHSETTFVLPPESEDNTRKVRIFTRMSEIPAFCTANAIEEKPSVAISSSPAARAEICSGEAAKCRGSNV